MHVSGDQDNNGDEEEESLSFVILDEEAERREQEHSTRETSKAEDMHRTQEIPETEICQSEEVNVKRETLENEILEAIRQAGLDDKFWIKKIREEFKVETVEELKNVTKDQVELFLQNTEITIQSRLRPVFSNLVGVDVSSRETVTSESVDVEHVKLEIINSQKVDVGRKDDVKHESTEEYPSSVALTERGVDENVEVIYSQNDREWTSTTEPTSTGSNQVEALLQSIGSLDEESLRHMFADSMGFSFFPGTSISGPEFIRSVDNGVLCRGIYFSEDIDKLVVDRELATNISDDVVFSEEYLEQPLHHKEFTSRESMYRFIDHIDKNVSMGMNILGIDLVDTVGQIDEADSYVGCVHYQFVPVVSAQFSLDQLSLRPEVISALQDVEQVLKMADYLPGDHFGEFFEKFGSHLCSGVVEFGGILISIAECSGFKEEDYSKVARAVTKVSEMAFLLGFNEKVQPGKPYNAAEVLGDVPDMSSENLQNITVTIMKMGGSQEAEEKDMWKEKLLKEDGKQWKVISRKSPLSGIWEMLQKYLDKFEDHNKLAETMMKEWEINLRPTEKSDKKEDGIAIDSPTEKRKRRIEEEQQLDSLRKDIAHWIEECRPLHLEELEQDIKKLADIRSRHQRIDHRWQNEVLYLRDIQTVIVDAVKLIMKNSGEDHEKKQRVSSLLRNILHPIDRIQENKFPNLRLITESINEIDGIDQTEPFEITSIQQLPDEWRKYKTLMNLEKENPNFPVKSAQLKLESTVKHQEQSPMKTYEHLIFVGVLQIFGFDTSLFRFGYQLLKRDMDIIFRLFEEHLTKFDNVQEESRPTSFKLPCTA